jgi:flavodoxin
MRALVVYESMFGNTEMVARHVADGLAIRPDVDVEVVDVGHAPTTVGSDVDLLVVGGPTHAFGLSRASTRHEALDQAGTTATPVDVGLREWLGEVQFAGRPSAAAFDTRVKVRGMPGSAARAAVKRLRRLGADTTAATSFWVTGTPGPLVDGELERAREWAASLAANVSITTERNMP